MASPHGEQGPGFERIPRPEPPGAAAPSARMAASPPAPDRAAAPVRAPAAPDEAERLWKIVAFARSLEIPCERGQLAENVARLALDLARAERAFVVRALAGSVEIEASRTFDLEEVRDAQSKLSRGILARAIEGGESVLAEDAAEDGELGALASVGRLRLRSVLCVPVRAAGRTVGALYLDNRFREGAFGDTERRLLEAAAEIFGRAIESSIRVDEVRSALARAEEERVGMRTACESQAIELARLASALASREEAAPLGHAYPEIVGRSGAMRKVLALVDRVASSDVPVLITGESGTGKELIARALHANSPRRAGPFVSENLAAISESIAESELFGHVRGAFTGAVADRPGLFELANGGTLFFDEIGDLPSGLQKKLLRALQEGEVRRVGGERPQRVDVRILCATNQDLKALVARGAFREDLYYRLNVVEIRLPPLRDRREDIPALVNHFLQRYAREQETARRGISAEALRLLCRRPWPGNVRELENAIRRLVAVSSETISQRDVLELDAGPGAAARPALKSLAELEREHAIEVLAACSWRPTEAARILGVSYPTLWRKMRAWGLRTKKAARPRG